MTRITHWLVVCLLALGAWQTAVVAEVPATQPEVEASTQPAGPLVLTQRGDLPVILSAPHGGRMKIPGADRRTGANVPKKAGAKNNFSVAFDRNVDKIALQTADEIERLTGKRPYLVIANFSRRFVDANRTAAEAYESEAAGAVYDEYHEAIREFRDEITGKWRRGLLIDIHGHGGDPEAVIRGTADWATVRHLVEEFGKESLTGPTGLLAPLEAAGNKIVPANSENDKQEVPALNGGFITRNYGSFQGGRFDAVQLELGSKYRVEANIPTFSAHLAESIVPFVDRYLLIPEPIETAQPVRTPRDATAGTKTGNLGD